MPLEIFKNGELSGLKNKTGRVLVDPTYSSIVLHEDLAICEYSHHGSESEVHFIDQSGDIRVDVLEKIPSYYRGSIYDLSPLGRNRIVFTYNGTGMELFGVMDNFASIIIEPEFDEFEMLPNGVIISFHGARDGDFDGYRFVYGKRAHESIFGNLISEDVFVDWEENETHDILHFKGGSKVRVSKIGNILE